MRYYKTIVRIPKDEHRQMLKIKGEKGIPKSLQLLQAWRAKYGTTE